MGQIKSFLTETKQQETVGIISCDWGAGLARYYKVLYWDPFYFFFFFANDMTSVANSTALFSYDINSYNAILNDHDYQEIFIARVH